VLSFTLIRIAVTCLFGRITSVMRGMCLTLSSSLEVSLTLSTLKSMYVLAALYVKHSTHGAYIEYDMLNNLSMHNSTTSQVLKMYSL